MVLYNACVSQNEQWNFNSQPCNTFSFFSFENILKEVLWVFGRPRAAVPNLEIRRGMFDFRRHHNIYVRLLAPILIQ